MGLVPPVNAGRSDPGRMVGPRGRFLDELLGFVFTRLVLLGAVLAAMWAFWHGHLVPAVGLPLALSYFFFLYWQYVTVGDSPAQ